MKTASLVLVFITVVGLCFAQESALQITREGSKVKTIRKGDFVRIAYPSDKLAQYQGKKEVVGIRGQIDSVGENQIKVKVAAHQQILMNIEDILNIKKSSRGAMIGTFIGTTAVLSGGAVMLGSAADANEAVTAFGGVVALFPSSILVSNLFFPARPVYSKTTPVRINVIAAP